MLLFELGDNMKTKSYLTIMLVLVTIFLFGCSVPNAQQEEVVGTLMYDNELVSINQAKELFSDSFSPQFPAGYQWGEYTYQKEFLPNNQQKPSNLLATKNNYYLTINNPQKYFNSTRKIYEAYSLIVATDALIHSPTSYGIAQADLDALDIKLAWLDGANEKFNYFEINGFNGTQLDTNLSYIEYNAYTDTIKQSYSQHRYPRVDKEIRDSGKPLMVYNQSVKYHIYQESNYQNIDIDNLNCMLIGYKLYIHFKVGNINYAIITPIGKVIYSANLFEAINQGSQEPEILAQIDQYTNYQANFDNIAQKITSKLVGNMIIQ